MIDWPILGQFSLFIFPKSIRNCRFSVRLRRHRRGTFAVELIIQYFLTELPNNLYSKMFNKRLLLMKGYCVKSVQIRNFFLLCIFPHSDWSISPIRNISPYSIRMRENTDQKKLRIWTLFTQWVLERLV